MSGLTPFEGRGESFLTPFEPSTTVELHQASTTTDTSVTTTSTPVICTTISATQDHQSTKSIPFLLPLWAWAAILLGVTVLVSVTIIWITLVVGWKKGKRKRERMDDQLSLNPRISSRRNSNLWIDENDGQGQQVQGEGTCTHTTDTRLPRSGNIGTGYPNSMYVKQHNDILKEMKAKSSLLLNEQDRDRGIRSGRERYGDRGARGDHGGHHDGPHSQTLPRSRQENSNVTDTSLRLSHRLIHLQPTTMSIFKQCTGWNHAQNNEHNDTHLDTAHTDNLPHPEEMATCHCTLGVCESDQGFKVNPFNYHNDPVDQDPSVRGLELLANIEGPQIIPLPLHTSVLPYILIVYYLLHSILLFNFLPTSEFETGLIKSLTINFQIAE